jgi:hypothetical protein
MFGPALIDTPREAVRIGYGPVLKCTENDVSAMAGFLAWGLPLRYLRDALLPAGWQVDRTGNFETVRSPDGKMAIASVRGDENTGTERMPSTATDKGPRTRKAVSVNRAQLAFDSKLMGSASNVVLLHEEAMTWFLLHYYDEAAQEIRLELAVPVEFVVTASNSSGEDRRVIATHFESRLPLEPILLEIGELGEETEGGTPEEEAAEEIDVSVRRRKP